MRRLWRRRGPGRRRGWDGGARSEMGSGFEEFDSFKCFAGGFHGVWAVEQDRYLACVIESVMLNNVVFDKVI